MRKLIGRGGVLGMLGVLGVLIAFGGAAFAQPGPGGAPAPAPAGAPATAPADSAPAATAPAPSTTTTTPPATTTSTAAADARKACTTAMNADPQFAAAIVQVADEKAAAKRDADTIAAHTDAVAHVQKNERHVIYAYAAMWIVAALFVIFLWRRQQALQAEITHLRRDLEAAASDATAGKARS